MKRQAHIDELRSVDRKRLGFNILETKSPFEKVFENHNPQSNFVLATNNERVISAYNKLINPIR